MQSKMITTAALFVLIILSGILVSRAGKPYPTGIFTVHKLIAVGALIFLAVTVNRAHQATALSTMELVAAVLAGLFFLGTIVTGGILSVVKTNPSAVMALHQITPVLTVLASAATLYLLNGRG